MIEIYAVNLRKIKKYVDGKIIQLSSERLQQINSLHHGKKKGSFIAEQIVHFYMKSIKKIDKYSIVIDNNGKPKLLNVPNLYFNISHSGDWVFCAFSDFEIGIDVERIEDAKMNIAKKYYNKLEYEKLNCIDNVMERNELFYLLWTLKESYLKNMGMSIGRLSPKIRFEIGNRINGYVGEKKIDKLFFSQKFDNNYYLSLCYEKVETLSEKKHINIMDYAQIEVITKEEADNEYGV